MSKLMMVAAGAVGYVFGARAGQERYTEIKNRATQLWQSPTVQEKKGQAQDLVKEKAPQVQEKVSDVASKAAAKGKRAASRTSSDDTDLEVETVVVPAAPTSYLDDVAEPTPVADGISRTDDGTHG